MSGTAALPDPDRTDEIPSEGSVLGGRYELRSLLGEGGMSQVHLAHDRELGRPVAVKLMRGSGEPDDVARLRDEARAAAAIDHPGVVTVHDAGESGGAAYVVMSYVEGDTLAQRVDRSGPLDVAEAVRVAVAVCDALGAAHAAGVVHRDVTPGNIILRPDGAVVVTDFGIARLGEGAGRTRTGHVIGTPLYLAPEQGRDTGRLDGRADLYSLACCLFTALTGRPPFTDPDPFAVVMAHLRATPPRPSTLRAGIPPALDAVLLRTLAKDPAHRPRDAAALAAALRAAVGAPPVPPARTRELPTGGDDPAHRDPAAATGSHALDSTIAEVESDESHSADRRRGLAAVLLVLAALVLVGLVVTLVTVG
ncbi:serine/threonine-protein kinase [Pseudonocardia spirodelae]|uniref:non-specific serine/threonine protein kinase n=1 Tax=Pseudonocardia spirodelae TaxID=3133431 RepID=A0ABU8T604_9PSEU